MSIPTFSGGYQYFRYFFNVLSFITKIVDFDINILDVVNNIEAVTTNIIYISTNMLVASYNTQDNGTNISSVSKTKLDIGTGIVNTCISDSSKML